MIADCQNDYRHVCDHCHPARPEAMSCARAIADATTRRVSAINFVESAVVIDASRDPIATRRFDDFIREADISIDPVTKVQAQIA